MKQTKRIEIHQTQITNQTHADKHVFPKRSVKMIDGTEKPQIPLKFAKRTAGYKEFRCNTLSVNSFSYLLFLRKE